MGAIPISLITPITPITPIGRPVALLAQAVDSRRAIPYSGAFRPDHRADYKTWSILWE